MDNLNARIENIPDEYFAIKRQAIKYLQNNSSIDNKKTLNIFHRPWVASLNWGIMLYQGVEFPWIKKFEEITGKIIPPFYQKFLLSMNGCFIHDIALNGIAPSVYSDGILNRSYLECHDLALANKTWIKEYAVDENYFHFGGRSYNDNEIIGYFSKEDKIMLIRKNGMIIKEWFNFSVFLEEEIKIAELQMLKEIPKKSNVIINE